MEKINGKKKVIFDIDFTLLVPIFATDENFFDRALGRVKFYRKLEDIISLYEKTRRHYDKEDFLYFLQTFTGSNLTDGFLENFLRCSSYISNQDNREVVDTLQYLKDSNYEIVALTNWFTEVQIEKLRQFGILNYFSYICGGEMALKPYSESYVYASGDNSFDECIMIGDSLSCDVIGPISNGMDAIHYTNGKDFDHGHRKIKRLNELKEIL